MIQITGDILKSAISYEINQVMNTDKHFTLYKEQTVQDMQKPCFFIWQINTDKNKEIGNRYKRIYQMEIRLHPEDFKADLYSYLGDIGEQLMDCLECINVPYDQINLVRGTGMNYLIQEDVLIFYVNYTILAQDSITHSITHNPMQQIIINQQTVKLPEPDIVGEYVVGTVYDVQNRVVYVGGKLISPSNLQYGMLVNESAVWSAIQDDEEIILLKSGDNYYVLDSKSYRLKDSVDGGEF